MEKESIDALDFDYYTFLNRWSLSFLGIWRTERAEKCRWENLRQRVHVSALCVLMMMLLIPQWLDMYVLWGNLDANAETFISNVFTLSVAFKLACFVEARDVFEVFIYYRELLDSLANWHGHKVD